MGALEASRDTETGQEASRAAPVPGAMAERGARAAMADPRTQEALAGQGTREAMADRGARVAMVDPGTQAGPWRIRGFWRPMADQAATEVWELRRPWRSGVLGRPWGSGSLGGHGG